MKQKSNSSKTTASRKRASSKSSKETLDGIFIEMLRDIYWAEKHLVKALPKLAKASHSEDLQSAFTSHLEETEFQVKRLEECFDIIQVKPSAKKCEAMEGLIKEGVEAIEEHDDGPARDAALIAAAQKAEHYEISAYGTLRTMANVLGKAQCAELLEASKDEEVAADRTLTELAEKINLVAADVEMESAA